MIIIGGEEETHPSSVRLFKNRPNMTFDDAGAPPDQEFSLGLWQIIASDCWLKAWNILRVEFWNAHKFFFASRPTHWEFNLEQNIQETVYLIDTNHCSKYKGTYFMYSVRDSDGTVEYKTKIVKFSSVHHLTLHFPANFGDDVTKV